MPLLFSYPSQSECKAVMMSKSRLIWSGACLSRTNSTWSEWMYLDMEMFNTKSLSLFWGLHLLMRLDGSLYSHHGPCPVLTWIKALFSRGGRGLPFCKSLTKENKVGGGAKFLHIYYSNVWKIAFDGFLIAVSTSPSVKSPSISSARTTREMEVIKSFFGPSCWEYFRRCIGFGIKIEKFPQNELWVLGQLTILQSQFWQGWVEGLRDQLTS